MSASVQIMTRRALNAIPVALDSEPCFHRCAHDGDRQACDVAWEAHLEVCNFCTEDLLTDQCLANVACNTPARASHCDTCLHEAEQEVFHVW